MGKVLSVICARAGSKGLPNKCIRKIKDKMVVEYSIEYSLSLGGEVKTVVSTDSPEIIGLCKGKGIAHIDRQRSLCTDGCTIDHVLADAIEQEGKGFEYCSIVYGNVPIRYPRIFLQAFDFLESNDDFDAAISMQNVEKFNPGWMMYLDHDILPRKLMGGQRRQDLPQMMIHDGHTLLFRSGPFIGRHKGHIAFDRNYIYSMFGAKIRPVINNEIIVDIDTEKDLKLAGALLFYFDRDDAREKAAL